MDGETVYTSSHKQRTVSGRRAEKAKGLSLKLQPSDHPTTMMARVGLERLTLHRRTSCETLDVGMLAVLWMKPLGLHLSSLRRSI